MKKHTLYTEAAYLLGLVLLALGVTLMEKADFGVSMIVAPAYILFRYIHPSHAFFTFGMAEYCLQAVLMLLCALALRRFKISYVLAFLTAVLYGFILDGCMLLFSFLPFSRVWQRSIYYLLGMVFSAQGVAMMFKTYLPPEVYELIVKELSEKFRFNIHKCKTAFDLFSLTVGILLSLCLFGADNFVGVKWGTIVCAFINGYIISLFSKLYDRLFVFKDALHARDFFESGIHKASKGARRGGNYGA